MLRCVFPIFVFLGFSVALVGCGSKGTVTGKVTLDGQPLKGGKIDFYNKDGQGATVEINDDGTYSLPVLVSGDYTVSVSTEYLKGSGFGGRPAGSGSGGGPGGMKGSAPPGGKAAEKPPVDIKKDKDATSHVAPEGYKASMPGEAAKKYVKIPEKYADPAQSGLTFTANGGAQTFDIALTSK